MKQLQSFFKRALTFSPYLAVAGIGFLAGVLWLTGVRFMTVHPAETHYHANFAVYINGQREEFKSFTYYEEVAACTAAYQTNPKGRVHMHNNVNDVIHVHDKRVTYADFFTNIGWSVGPDFIRTGSELLVDTDQKQVVYMLNGTKVDRIDGRIIGNEDKLLVSYDAPTADFDGQFKAIENFAEQYNNHPDPGNCSGLDGPAANNFWQRLNRSFLGQ